MTDPTAGAIDLILSPFELRVLAGHLSLTTVMGRLLGALYDRTGASEESAVELAERGAQLSLVGRGVLRLSDDRAEVSPAYGGLHRTLTSGDWAIATALETAESSTLLSIIIGTVTPATGCFISPCADGTVLLRWRRDTESTVRSLEAQVPDVIDGPRKISNFFYSSASPKPSAAFWSFSNGSSINIGTQVDGSYMEAEVTPNEARNAVVKLFRDFMLSDHVRNPPA